ncbi:PIR Superfamily Protein [Plasmodium ovale wallikeri]|uniref:PIR Superfamily Protein n=1 Tax=Plasmodium ovale wallikeri TaxID=864142 RepID=A0A1A9AD31_PLAOA|nr:PIR Superfamily Protein [Plasmodium ovale wallikeri]SBT54042.1 PIR Superfamily Protein [Plasmodium ovale wallikeri]
MDTSQQVLYNLPSYQFHGDLYRGGNLEGYSMYCESIDKNLPKYKDIFDICTKLTKNIVYLDESRTENASLFLKHCYDLNFWLYYYVQKILNYTEKDKNFKPTIEGLHNAWKNFNSYVSEKSSEQCIPKPIKYTDSYVKTVKAMNDYVENFSTIKEEIGENTTESKKYCKYLRYAQTLYSTFQSLCPNNEKDNCTTLIQKYEEYNPIKLTSSLSCDESGTSSHSYEVNDLLWTLESQSSTSNMFEYILKYIGLDDILGSLPSIKNIFNSSNFDVAAIGGLSFVGIFIIIFILYKCIPFSSLLRFCMCKKRKSRNNTEQEEMQYMLYDNSESYDMTRYNMAHLLAHHTMSKN